MSFHIKTQVKRVLGISISTMVRARSLFCFSRVYLVMFGGRNGELPRLQPVQPWKQNHVWPTTSYYPTCILPTTNSARRLIRSFWTKTTRSAQLGRPFFFQRLLQRPPTDLHSRAARPSPPLSVPEHTAPVAPQLPHHPPLPGGRAPSDRRVGCG